MYNWQGLASIGGEKRSEFWGEGQEFGRILKMLESGLPGMRKPAVLSSADFSGEGRAAVQHPILALNHWHKCQKGLCDHSFQGLHRGAAGTPDTYFTVYSPETICY